MSTLFQIAAVHADHAAHASAVKIGLHAQTEVMAAFVRLSQYCSSKATICCCRDNAIGLVTAYVPSLTHADKREALRAAADHILNKGTTDISPVRFTAAVCSSQHNQPAQLHTWHLPVLPDS